MYNEEFLEDLGLKNTLASRKRRTQAKILSWPAVSIMGKGKVKKAPQTEIIQAYILYSNKKLDKVVIKENNSTYLYGIAEMEVYLNYFVY